VSPDVTDLASRLARLDACAISDALDKLGIAGVVTGIHRLSSDMRIWGRVVTVKLEPDDGRPAASKHLSTTAVETAQPGDVIVVEQRTGIDAAGWGGNLSFGAKLRGISGVIVEGPARDLDESRAYGFPVFARDHTSRTARGRLVETGTNLPIKVGDIAVSAGDYVVADGSAVVFIAAADVHRVLETAEKIADNERAMVEQLRQGTPISQVMGKTYETLLKR
jgi:4-hydroxy-4-methyl-2-oxoglutarate aldolase